MNMLSRKRQGALFSLTAVVLICQSLVDGFTPLPLARCHSGSRTSIQRFVAHETSLVNPLEEKQIEEPHPTAVRAPLKFVGPYPVLGLRFPNLATAAQRSRNVTGISLDFVLDTAANTNTINEQVAKELKLPAVGNALPGVGASGAIQGATTYLLGDSQLEGVFEADGETPFTFMTNLTASALPIASPATAGLLSLAFFYSFEGGVELQWGGTSRSENDAARLPPSITFYSETDPKTRERLDDMIRVPVQPIDKTNLPAVTIVVNGVEMPALLDTGSPITVLNSQAAKVAGVESFSLDEEPNEKSNFNLFAGMVDKMKGAQKRAQASARGEVVSLAGGDGKLIDLFRSKDKVDVGLKGSPGKEDVSFGSGNIYVGDIPGLAALNGLGIKAPPAAILGMDVLRTRPSMFFRPRDNEVYF